MERRRADIQGLRAIAIILVVAYHGGLRVHGGFTGVDVFFVISGFVITAMLGREIREHGRIDLPAFYRRRVKRLLPALAVMVAVVALAGIALTPIGVLRTTALTAVTAPLFVANAFLYGLPTGYFDVDVTLDPLLHTWTLAVEEQFYVVFPSLLFVAWWFGRRRNRSAALATVLVGAVTAASFVLSLVLSRGGLLAAAHRPQQLAFYSSPTRAWEFGIGALLALGATRVERLPRAAAELLGVGGMAAIVAGAITISSADVYPGTLALYPALGAGAVVAAGTARSRAVELALAPRALGWIGDRSYSWYLWHWPTIVFAKAVLPPSSWVAPCAAVVSLLPSAASYRWIENPIRFDRRLRGARVVALAAVAIAVPVAAGGALLGAHALLDRTTAVRDWQRSRAPHLDELRGCEGATPFGAATPAQCTWHVAKPRGTVVLIGDSNASHFAEPVVAAGNRAGYDVTVATFFGCPLVPLRVAGSSSGEDPCRQFTAGSVAALVAAHPALVVTAARADEYINGPIALGTYGGPLDRQPAAKARLWQSALARVLRRLNGAGIPVVVVEPLPQGSTRASASCAVVLILTHDCLATTGRRAVERELGPALTADRAAIATASKSYDLDLHGILCPADRCHSVLDGRILYRDSDHLSVAGSRLFTSPFYRAISADARR